VADLAASVMALQAEVTSWKASGQTVVFTNGVFDVLHVGHVAVLQAAAAEGDRLVVGINSDASVRGLGKGADRPIHPESDRATLLAALRCVDAVVVFDAPTPLEIIETLRPDVVVKGGDYRTDVTDPSDPAYIVGSREVATWGGRAVAVPLVPGKSTTATLARIRKA
jgi:rfaE bifunctional protein nucleotidyltransferase chain/domain